MGKWHASLDNEIQVTTTHVENHHEAIELTVKEALKTYTEKDV